MRRRISPAPRARRCLCSCARNWRRWDCCRALRRRRTTRARRRRVLLLASGAATAHLLIAMNERKTPARKEVTASPSAEVAAFLRKARAIGALKAARKGRLILALDATMSRQPTWDLACSLQAEMFDAVGRAGGLDVQLVYFRGFGECRASRFVGSTDALKDLMVRIDCRGGHTQIRKVLKHALRETGREPVDALVYIGDAL